MFIQKTLLEQETQGLEKAKINKRLHGKRAKALSLKASESIMVKLYSGPPGR
jgi:hypothetical protein